MVGSFITCGRFVFTWLLFVKKLMDDGAFWETAPGKNILIVLISTDNLFGKHIQTAHARILFIHETQKLHDKGVKVGIQTRVCILTLVENVIWMQFQGEKIVNILKHINSEIQIRIKFFTMISLTYLRNYVLKDTL